MDLVSCRYFVEATKDLNFTQTAKRLFISQQTLSNHIARLERECGVLLFDRKPALKLTYAGEAFLAFAQEGLMEESSLKQKFAEISQAERGVLHVGCSPNRSSLIVSGIVGPFLERYPHVQLVLHHHDSSALFEMALTGELDFSVSVPEDRRPSLVTDPVFEDSTLLLVSDHLLKTYYPENYALLLKSWQKGVEVEDFSRLPLLTIRGSELVEGITRRFQEAPNLAISSNIPLFYAVDSFEKYAAAVISKGNYHFLKGRVKSDVHTFPILMDHAPVRHTIAVIRHRRKYLSPYGAAFVELVKEAFKTIEAG